MEILEIEKIEENIFVKYMINGMVKTKVLEKDKGKDSQNIKDLRKAVKLFIKEKGKQK